MPAIIDLLVVPGGKGEKRLVLTSLLNQLLLQISDQCRNS